MPNAGTAKLAVDGSEVQIPLNPKTFSTGSVGLFWQGKVDGSDGRRYQTQVTLTLIGSKPAK